MEQYLLTTYVFCLIFTIVCYICALTSFLWFYHLRKLYTYIHIFLYTLMTLFCRKFYVQKKIKRWIYLFTFLICHKLRGLKEKERKHTEKYNLTLLYKYPSFLWDYLTLFIIFFSDFTGFPFIRGGISLIRQAQLPHLWFGNWALENFRSLVRGILEMDIF